MPAYYDNGNVQLYLSDARSLPLPDVSVDCVVTSPPYWGLRDYGDDEQLGLEPTLDGYVVQLVNVFREVWRVLKPHGTVWLNLGDSYASGSSGERISGMNERTGRSPGSRKQGLGDTRRAGVRSLKPKDLVGIPWRVAFALQADGWWLRSDIIWSKPNPMPESVTDRPTKAHEYLFLLAKAERYYYDADAIREPARDWGTRDRTKYRNGTEDPKLVQNGMTNINFAEIGRNKRSVWEIATQPYPDAHFATFPVALVEPCILAGCPPGGVVLDPFSGSGTVASVSQKLGRRSIGVDINSEYLSMAARRIGKVSLPMQLGVGE